MEAQRYPISVRLIGVMHKEKSKMFMTSVLWSDQNEIVVYRTFEDFQTMHKKMKKAFPPASKLNKSDRVIPKFRAKARKSNSKKKAPTKSLVRLRMLQKYSNELLSCDPRVCQSADLVQFFHPKDKDLEPEFSKNSIMIIPAEDEIKADAGQSGNVTQPFVTETYRCVAPYETKDTKNKPFKVTLDEQVDVLIKDKAGWWLVEKEDKRMAWFPAPYLDKLEDDEDDEEEDEFVGTCGRGQLYNAVKSYKATKDDEITVAVGSVVELLEKSDNGWWLIRYSGNTGYIPTMCLQPYNYPQIRIAAHHPGQRTSSPLLLPPSGLGGQQSQQLSRSQGNLLKMPHPRSLSPLPAQPESMHRSRSLNLLSEPAPAAPPRTTSPHARVATTTPNTPNAAQFAPPPTIMVEMDEPEEGLQRSRSSTEDSDRSFLSDSGSDFSFSGSDELSSSSASLSFNLSPTTNQDQLRLSRTPPPTASNRLSPTSAGSPGRLIPSASDPNLYKGPTMPKVPPRPNAQEILTRCSTVTRKNATKGALSPTATEIQSR